MPRVLPVIIGVVLTIYAVADCVCTPGYQLPGRVPKPLWIAVIVLLPFLGPIVWLVASRVTRAETGIGRVDSRFSFGKNRPQAPVAPDDNEDFLFALEAQMYRERKQRQRHSETPAATESDEAGTNNNEDDGPDLSDSDGKDRH